MTYPLFVNSLHCIRMKYIPFISCKTSHTIMNILTFVYSHEERTNVTEGNNILKILRHLYTNIHEGSLLQFSCANCLRFVQTRSVFNIRHRHVRKHFDLCSNMLRFSFHVIYPDEILRTCSTTPQIVKRVRTRVMQTL